MAQVAETPILVTPPVDPVVTPAVETPPAPIVPIGPSEKLNIPRLKELIRMRYPKASLSKKPDGTNYTRKDYLRFFYGQEVPRAKGKDGGFAVAVMLPGEGMPANGLLKSPVTTPITAPIAKAQPIPGAVSSANYPRTETGEIDFARMNVTEIKAYILIKYAASNPVLTKAEDGTSYKREHYVAMAKGTLIPRCRATPGRQ